MAVADYLPEDWVLDAVSNGAKERNVKKTPAGITANPRSTTINRKDIDFLKSVIEGLESGEIRSIAVLYVGKPGGVHASFLNEDIAPLVLSVQRLNAALIKRLDG